MIAIAHRLAEMAPNEDDDGESEHRGERRRFEQATRYAIPMRLTLDTRSLTRRAQGARSHISPLGGFGQKSTCFVQRACPLTQ